MIERIALSLIAALFLYMTGLSLWKGEFQYHFGPTIRRREKPIEYWVMNAVMICVTTILCIIALGRWTGFVGPAGR